MAKLALAALVRRGRSRQSSILSRTEDDERGRNGRSRDVARSALWRVYDAHIQLYTSIRYPHHAIITQSHNSNMSQATQDARLMGECESLSVKQKQSRKQMTSRIAKVVILQARTIPFAGPPAALVGRGDAAAALRRCRLDRRDPIVRGGAAASAGRGPAPVAR